MHADVINAVTVDGDLGPGRHQLEVPDLTPLATLALAVNRLAPVTTATWQPMRSVELTDCDSKWLCGAGRELSYAGWPFRLLSFQPNTYTFTKGLAERLMEEAAEHLPIIITRPSIVVPSYSDPLPGWNDNLNGLAGFLVAAFKGLLRCIHGHNTVYDSVPVDAAAKLIVMSSWARGLGLRLSDRQVDVVNVTVGQDYGANFEELQSIGENFDIRYRVPFPGAIRSPDFRFEPCPVMYAALHIYQHLLFGFIIDLILKAMGQKPRLLNLYRKAEVACAATTKFRKPFVFTMQNQRKLQAMIHPSDMRTLDFLEIYNSRDSYEVISNFCLLQMRGLLRYTLKEEDNPDKYGPRLKWLEWLWRAYHCVMAVLFFGILALSFKLFSKSKTAFS